MTVGARKNISMLVPALPPRLDGIGDYSAIVAAGLASNYDVALVVKAQNPPSSPVPGVESIAEFAAKPSKAIVRVYDHVLRFNANGLLLQYNPFSYGRRGLNLWLPTMLRRVQKAGLPVGVMAHETYVVSGSALWRLIGKLQQMQLRAIVQSCTLAYTSCDRYREHVLSVAPGSKVQVMPIGSNIPRVEASRETEKARLGIPATTTVLGMFGTTQSGVQPEFIAETQRKCHAAGHEVIVLYVGSQGARLREYIPDAHLMDLGRLAPEDVSKALTAMDIYLATFDDGISTRRGTVMAALQHGTALVGTRGKNTDGRWQHESNRSLLLARADDAQDFANSVLSLVQDRERTLALGQMGADLYAKCFDWPHTIAATTRFME